MVETRTLMTAKELELMADDGWQYELRRGELIKMSPAFEDHGRREVRALVGIVNFADAHDLGQAYAADTGFKLESDPDTVRAPDIAFVRRARVRPIDEATGYYPGAPDLAIEIVSRSERAGEIMEKVADYLKAGTSLVWIYRPRPGTLAIFRADGSVAELKAGDSVDGEDVLPGFAMTVAELFAAS